MVAHRGANGGYISLLGWLFACDMPCGDSKRGQVVQAFGEMFIFFVVNILIGNSAQ